jgi:hypothetical protein
MLIPAFRRHKSPALFLLGWRKRQPVFLAVGQALELRHQFALVVLYLDGIRTDLEVLGHFPGVGPKRAGGGGFHEGDAHVEGHGHRPMRIARRGKGEIGQREDGPAMDRSQAVQMVRMQRHLRPGIAVPSLEQFDVVARGELVAFEKFLDCFHVKSIPSPHNYCGAHGVTRPTHVQLH